MRRARPIGLEPLEGRHLTTGLTAHLTTNHAVYSRGEAVVITLVETNTSKQDVIATEGPSLDGFSASEGGREVWRSNLGPQAQFVIVRDLAPGQSIRFSASWDGRPNEGTIPNPYGPFMIRSDAAGAHPVMVRFARS